MTRQIEIMYHLLGYNKNTIISVMFLPKMHNLNLLMRKYLIKPH